MKNFAFLTILLVMFSSAYCQNIPLDIKSKKVTECFLDEENHNSQRIENTSRLIYASFRDRANRYEKPVLQPVVYKRNQPIIPSRVAVYRFYEIDSTIQSISYSWYKSDFYNINDTLVKSMIHKYDSLQNYITAEIGPGASSGKIENNSLLSLQNGFYKRTVWRTNDSIDIHLYIRLAVPTEGRSSGCDVALPTSGEFLMLLEIVNKSNHRVEFKSVADLKNSINGFFNELESGNYDIALKQFGAAMNTKKPQAADLQFLSSQIRSYKRIEFIGSSKLIITDEGRSQRVLRYRIDKKRTLAFSVDCMSGKILSISKNSAWD
jgi:hypothetical protein